MTIVPYRLPKRGQAILLAATLAEGLRAVPTMTTPPPRPTPPPGMKWLVSPREALEARPGHSGGDARTMEIAFARWLFWRVFITHRRPTPAAFQAVARRFVTLVWRNLRTLKQQATQQQRAAGDGGEDVSASESDLAFLMSLNPEELAQLRLNPDQIGRLADMLTWEPFFSGLADLGISDLQIAQMLDASWNGQASLWAGQDVYDEAGIAGTFDIRDPYFYDYLAQQSGYLISGIDRTTRYGISEALNLFLGGTGYEDIPRTFSVDYIARRLSQWFSTELGPDADWRAYLIAVTETARAESFGTFAALWMTGARQKIWIVNAGACLFCLANADAGPIDLTADFPSGVQSPPTHPLDRCAISAWVDSAWSPDEWTPRDPGPLNDYLFNWQGAAWPDVDLSELADVPDIDASDFGLAARPAVLRAGAGVTHLARPHMLALGRALSAAAETLARQWCREAHVHFPATDADLRSLTKRVQTPDELPDVREADEQYIHRLRQAVRDAVKAAATAKES